MIGHQICLMGKEICATFAGKQSEFFVENGQGSVIRVMSEGSGNGVRFLKIWTRLDDLMLLLQM